jgi:hypothetical protein
VSGYGWRAVVGWEGVYEVSSRGEVRSAARVLRGWINGGGYPTVSLCLPGRRQNIGVHILVLEAFIGPRPGGLQACHADDVKTNNAVENLRWDTPSANTYDRIANGLHVQARKTHCPAGHPYDYRDAGGTRRCRTCNAANNRRYRERRAA